MNYLCKDYQETLLSHKKYKIIYFFFLKLNYIKIFIYHTKIEVVFGDGLISDLGGFDEAVQSSKK